MNRRGYIKERMGAIDDSWYRSEGTLVGAGEQTRRRCRLSTEGMVSGTLGESRSSQTHRWQRGEVTAPGDQKSSGLSS